MALFDIRAELPQERHHDFKVTAHERAPLQPNTLGTPAFKVAREIAGERLRKEHGSTAQLEWRGMVCFVNRAIPFST